MRQTPPKWLSQTGPLIFGRLEPNDFVAEVHDRMPVLLQPDQFEHWLSGSMPVEELKPAPNDYLQRWAVSKRVNSSKADKDDATLIEPVKQAA
jgi:putative SOS response-associated peptidase YedK